MLVYLDVSKMDKRSTAAMSFVISTVLWTAKSLDSSISCVTLTGGLMLHNFKEERHDTASFFEDEKGVMYLTCTHVLKCWSCGLIIGDSQIPRERIPCNIFPGMEGCSGKKPKVEKPKWQAPINKEREVNKRDYPAKRGGKK
jgi:hypothetical protein